jgi:deaminated glutathione amidase
MSRNFLAAAVQMTSGLDAAANMRSAEHWVHAATSEGVKLVALPELFVCYGDHAETIKHAQPLDGSIVTQMRSWARENSIWLVAGSYPERDSSDGSVYNTSLLIDPSGNIVMRYRKRYLFNIKLKEGVDIQESAYYSAGNKCESVSTQCGVIGLAICFDLRFPQHFQTLSRMGAELVVVPSAFTQKTGKDHWELLLRARAVENLSYVIAPNLVGAQSPRMLSYGHSSIVDPWGNILAACNRDEEGIAIAEIDLEFLHDVRRQLPVLKIGRDKIRSSK